MQSRCEARRWSALAVLVLAGSFGCSEAPAGPADYSLIPALGKTFFLVSPIVHDANMEALFQGKVLRDDSGCLRLQSPSSATVVWPKGFTLESGRSGVWVMTEKGRGFGVIGGAFRFGGGEVPFLHEGLGFSPELAGQIQVRCPGRFWIVGDTTL